MPSGFVVPRRIQFDMDPERPDPRKALHQGQVNAVGRVLWDKYPGHPWHIEMPGDGSIVKIQLRGLMGPTNWYVIHTTNLKGEDGRRLVIRAGGELLERFKMPRLGFSLDDYRAAVAAVPPHRRFHGHVPG